jgi:uncharacterized protein (UPF0332 family)
MNQELSLTLNEAKECLTDAQIMFEQKRWKASVSRAYYAMYHAAKAALLSINVDAFTHQGVNIQFSKHFVKTEIFDRNFSKVFSKMLDTRQKADYEIGFSADESDAQHAIEEAEYFYNEILKYLENNTK